eukprot:CAMPEP_0168760198 /NCGR_PEP_ID=MMETSP0724-20121128/22632_1 /TAXON_ID=265536 /ORGANISM="Amphiprora sp., Strain CCMP467" /LENGTH=391 /DNA_ID=CAMNT_0008809179 /DNA_START=145 /DNA_END=1320 /DNA_ORIENTATION=+
MPRSSSSNEGQTASEISKQLDENQVIRSRCQCGNVELAIPIRSILPLEHGEDYKAAVDCHCPACRKYHVAAFSPYLLALADHVDATGANIQTVRDSCRTLGPVVRTQCGVCRSKLATRPLRVEARYGHQLLINMGAIDDRTIPAKLATYFQTSRGKWNWDKRAVWTEALPEFVGYDNGLDDDDEWEDVDGDDDDDDDDDGGDDDDDDDDDGGDDEQQEQGNEENHTEATNCDSSNNDSKIGFITGSCTCGQSRYRVRLTGPTEMQHCYCRLCRRLSGGPFQTWVPVEPEDFEWVQTGDADDDNSCQEPPMQQYVPHGRRHVCDNCGSVLTIVYNGEPQVWPAAGGFDDASLPATTKETSKMLHGVMHISCRYKQKWYAIPDDGCSRIREAG